MRKTSGKQQKKWTRAAALWLAGVMALSLAGCGGKGGGGGIPCGADRGGRRWAAFGMRQSRSPYGIYPNNIRQVRAYDHRDGQNCILLYGGANRRMTKEYIDEVLRDFKEKDILLLQNEVNLVPYMIERAYEKGMTVVLNPSPYDKEMDGSDFQKAFQKVSMFILNEVEGEQMTGEAQPEKILLKMKSLYPESITVLTLGEQGSICQQRIYPVKAVDTTAAGDTFTGYFLSSVMEGMPAPEGLALAAKASAIAVSKSGAAASIPLRDEVERF